MEFFHAIFTQPEFTMKVKALILSLTLAIGGGAFAQTATPNLDKREAKQ